MGWGANSLANSPANSACPSPNVSVRSWKPSATAGAARSSVGASVAGSPLQRGSMDHPSEGQSMASVLLKSRAHAALPPSSSAAGSPAWRGSGSPALRARGGAGGVGVSSSSSPLRSYAQALQQQQQQQSAGSIPGQ
eukprot:scaffold297686_cov15-Tisochrysis_lutea.AAC.1